MDRQVLSSRQFRVCSQDKRRCFQIEKDFKVKDLECYKAKCLISQKGGGKLIDFIKCTRDKII